ncbi:MAG TPA: hypothetical protein VGN17_28905 [Bryobacteraceae bacterium]|jgi:hypothetical protein
MSDEKDLRIAGLLHQGAPPSRDPVFRVSVLERREQRRFQRRLYTMLAGVVLILLIAVAAQSLAGPKLERAGALLAAGAIGVACVAFRGSLGQVRKRFSL